MPQRPDLPVDGSTITTAWGTTVRNQIVTPFSTSGVRSSEIGSPVAGQVSTLTASDNTNGLYVYNGTSWRLPWNMPWGIVAISATPASLDYTNTIAYSSTFTWSAVNRRYYRVTLTGNLENSTVTGADMSLAIYNNAATPVAQVVYPKSKRSASNEIGFAGGSGIYEATATGTQTWKLGGVHGFATAVTVSYFPSSLIIEDLGPDGAPV